MVEVQKYNPQWNNRFQSISSNFLPHIKDMVEDVIHVGSTSIKGMSANPRIDIDIIVENFDQLDELSGKLRLSGYKLDNDSINADNAQFTHTKTIPHQLLVVKKDSLTFKCRKLFKEYIEQNSEAFKDYLELKHKYTIGKIKFDKYDHLKNELIKRCLIAQGLSEQEIVQL